MAWLGFFGGDSTLRSYLGALGFFLNYYLFVSKKMKKDGKKSLAKFLPSPNSRGDFFFFQNLFFAMYGYVRSKRKIKKALGVARLAALWRDQRLGLLFVFVFCFVLFFLGGVP